MRKASLCLTLALACAAVCEAQTRPTARRLSYQEPVSSRASAADTTAADPAEADASVFTILSRKSQIELVENAAIVLRLPSGIVRVSGFNETVVKVSTLPPSSTEVHVAAIGQGMTSIVLTNDRNQSFTVDVTVLGDVRELEALIKRLFPDSTVRAVKLKDGSVLLQGMVSRPDQVTTIVRIAEKYATEVLNYLEVAGVQQVLLRCRIMEVQRGKIRQLGFNFLHLDENGYTAGTVGGLAPLDTLTVPFGGPPGAEIRTSALASQTAMFGLTSADFIFQGFIEALKQERLLKILAEPNLVAINGQSANFLSGGEFPIPVPQSLGTVTIQWKNFGVQLEFVPNVLGDGRLRLDVKPEVSDQDPTTGVTLNGTTVPGLAVRRVQTQVEMEFGQTLIIAGLINNRIRAETSKVPFLGELPWLGAAFRRVRHDEAETELLVMVTPELISPVHAEFLPRIGPGSSTVSPTDSELFRLGLLEVPKVAEPCEGCETGVEYVPASSGIRSPVRGTSPSPAPRAAGGTRTGMRAAPRTESPGEGLSTPAYEEEEFFEGGEPPPPPAAASASRSSGIRQAGGTQRRSRPSLIPPDSSVRANQPAAAAETPRKSTSNAHSSSAAKPGVRRP